MQDLEARAATGNGLGFKWSGRGHRPTVDRPDSHFRRRSAARRTRESEESFLSPPSVPIWKHGFDLLFLVLTFPVWLPVMCLIALGIKMVSRGPIFFLQERIGYGNKPFVCLKFRSMKADADTSLHSSHMRDLISHDLPMIKMDNAGDPRLIRFGSLLRSSGLDELPQFINVLRREMSLVGPRPCTLAEYEHYADWQKERFNTLPGLTGLWQVSGKNRTTFKQMMKLDIHYARNKTLGMDLGIVVKTLPAIFVQIQDIKGPQDSPRPLDRQRRA